MLSLSDLHHYHLVCWSPEPCASIGLAEREAERACNCRRLFAFLFLSEDIENLLREWVINTKIEVISNITVWKWHSQFVNTVSVPTLQKPRLCCWLFQRPSKATSAGALVAISTVPSILLFYCHLCFTQWLAELHFGLRNSALLLHKLMKFQFYLEGGGRLRPAFSTLAFLEQRKRLC